MEHDKMPYGGENENKDVKTPWDELGGDTADNESEKNEEKDKIIEVTLEKEKSRYEFVLSMYGADVSGEHPASFELVRDLGMRNGTNYSSREMSQETQQKIENEWSPIEIEKKYGDSVEEYGVSMSELYYVTVRMNSEAKEAEGGHYGYFCDKLPGIIDRHFSEKVSEEEKKLFASIIHKCSGWYDENGDMAEHRQNHNLNDEELNLFAKYVYDPQGNVGWIGKDEQGDYRGYVPTGDGLVDGMMETFDYAASHDWYHITEKVESLKNGA